MGAYSAVWHAGYVILVSGQELESKVRSYIRNLADEFANDYLAENPNRAILPRSRN